MILGFCRHVSKGWAALEIKGFIHNTLLDWEGRIAAIVFTPGCNCRCPYCHSPHLVFDTDDLETIPEETVLDFMQSNRAWIDGLVITGGEPTILPDLREFLARLKEGRIPVKLDTNGSRPEILRDILDRGLVEYVAMDVKAPREKYQQTVGVALDVEAVVQSVRMLIDGDVDYEFRTTINPTMELPGDIEKIARWINGARRYRLQGFRPGNCLDVSLNDKARMPAKMLFECARIAEEFVDDCRVRGESAAPTNSE